MAGVGVIASSPSISPEGNQLVYTQSFIKENISRLNLKDEKHSQGFARSFEFEERTELAAELFCRWEKVCVRIGFGILGDLGL